MRLCVVGGSNSVVKDGYVQHLVTALETEHGIVVSSVTNLAIGGTSTFTGLARLIKTGAHRCADVMIIEYSLNDSDFNKASSFFDLWGEAYEGLVRRALTDNPKLTVIPVILGKRNGAYRRRICPISSGVHTIARRYTLDVMDVNEMLLYMHPDPVHFDQLYVDESHYARPSATRPIGQAVAKHIARNLVGHRPSIDVESVKKIYEKNLSTAKYLDEFKDVGGLGYKKSYRNSLFNSDTTFLPPRSNVRLALTGRIHLIEFVSTPSSSDILIKLNNDTFKQHTTRRTFAGAGMAFLLGAILPEFHTGRSLRGLKASLEIEVLQGGVGSSGTSDAGNEAAGPLMAPISDKNPGFSIEGILYSGRLVRG